jgi:hypothetical protein
VPKSVFKRSKTYTHCCNRSIWTSSPPVQVSSNVVCAEISNERQVQSDWKVLRRRILIALCYYRSCPCSKQAAGPVYHGSVPVDQAEFNEVIRTLEHEGAIKVVGAGERRTIKRISD